MLSLSRKADYALISLAYMAERAEQVCSAREIAAAQGLPLPLLMNILKNLHSHGLLVSRRGVKGGYQIAINLDTMNLCELIAIVECSGHGDCGCQEPAGEDEHLGRDAIYSPVQALQYKLRRFLRQIRLSDLIIPGRRIDVPLERVKFRNPSLEKARV
jgi:Rrf2 family protein